MRLALRQIQIEGLAGSRLDIRHFNPQDQIWQQKVSLQGSSLLFS
jgi:hypothetical protein